MNVYEIITERILSELEKGNIPWRKPWCVVGNGVTGRAYNYVTMKPYSLLNQMLLKHQDAYLSFKQIQNAGGKINKGAKSEIVVFWKMIKTEEKKEDNTIEEKMIPILRYYNVFWIGDTDIKNTKVKVEEGISNNPIEKAEDIINNYVEREGLTFVNSELTNEAYYSPAMDLVNVPMLNQYEEVEEYYSTAFHELTHSTGAENRLNRLKKGREARFGGEEYSKEELVAELGASALVNYCGIESDKSFKNSVAYIQSWISTLRNDSRMIVSASSKAEKAVDYILNGRGGEE